MYLMGQGAMRNLTEKYRPSRILLLLMFMCVARVRNYRAQPHEVLRRLKVHFARGGRLQKSPSYLPRCHCQGR